MYRARITWQIPAGGGKVTTLTEETKPLDMLDRATLSGVLKVIKNDPKLGYQISRAVMVPAGVAEHGLSAWRVWHPVTGNEGRLSIVRADEPAPTRAEGAIPGRQGAADAGREHQP